MAPPPRHPAAAPGSSGSPRTGTGAEEPPTGVAGTPESEPGARPCATGSRCRRCVAAEPTALTALGELDCILMRKDQPQIYGSQVSYNPETGEGSVFEIQDPEYVNQRRKAIGLGPIEDYLKKWDIEWTVPQKEK